MTLYDLQGQSREKESQAPVAQVIPWCKMEPIDHNIKIADLHSGVND